MAEISQLCYNYYMGAVTVIFYEDEQGALFWNGWKVYSKDPTPKASSALNAWLSLDTPSDGQKQIFSGIASTS